MHNIQTEWVCNMKGYTQGGGIYMEEGIYCYIRSSLTRASVTAQVAASAPA